MGDTMEVLVLSWWLQMSWGVGLNGATDRFQGG